MGETHLVDSIGSSFVSMEGYSVVRGDVRGQIRKHGVCLYFSNNLQFEKVEIGCPNLAAVHLVHYVWWILTLYRPPLNSNEENATLIEIMLEFCQGREVVVFEILICLLLFGQLVMEYLEEQVREIVCFLIALLWLV